MRRGFGPDLWTHSGARELEIPFAEFIGLPRALYFSTGYMANLGIVPSLVGPGDTVFCDKLNHACLIDGARLSGAEFRVYSHRDLATLERRLARCTSPSKLVASDAVFSMGGDIALIPELFALCERYDAGRCSTTPMASVCWETTAAAA